MRISLDNTSSVPMYEQIKNAIKENIYSGEVKDKELLPSIRQLAKELDVSMITVKRAYMDLEYEGLINTISGRGTFVKMEDHSLIMEHYKNELLIGLRDEILKLKRAGIKEEEIIKLVLNEYSLMRSE